MRYRSRNNIVNIPYMDDSQRTRYVHVREKYKYDVLVDVTTSSSTYPYSNISLNGSEEEMWDTVSEGARRINPCTHRKKTISMNGASQTVEWYTGNIPSDYTKHTRTSVLPSGRGFTNSDKPNLQPFGSFALTDPRLRGCASKHYSDLVDVVQEQISIANFAYELREISQLEKSFSQLWKAIKRGKPGKYGPSANDLFVNSTLAYQYGIKPLISDLTKLGQSFTGILDTIDRIERLYSGSVGVKTQENLELTPAPLYIPGYTEAISALRRGQKISGRVAEVRMSSRVSYNGLPVESYKRNILAALKMFGLTNPARIVWNAIPYSFVVDYVFNVNDMLRRVDLLYPFLERTVTESCTMIKQSQSVEVFAYIPKSAAAGRQLFPDGCYMYEQPMAEHSSSLFERYPGLPKDPGLFASFPSIRELVLSQMLARQRATKGSSPKITWSRL